MPNMADYILKNHNNKNRKFVPAQKNAIAKSVSDYGWLFTGDTVAFDKTGNRLGYGKGFYDKLLKHVIGNKIGICYNFQLTDTLRSDIWDIKMTHIITETLILDIH